MTKRWYFDEEAVPPKRGASDVIAFMNFMEWMEERDSKKKEAAEKKSKEEKKDDSKGFNFWGLTKRELFWYMLISSPFVGTITASIYIGFAVALWKVIRSAFT